MKFYKQVKIGRETQVVLHTSISSFIGVNLMTSRRPHYQIMLVKIMFILVYYFLLLGP